MVSLTKETAFVGLRVIHPNGNRVAGTIIDATNFISVLWDDTGGAALGYSPGELASYIDEIVPMRDDEDPQQGVLYMCIDDDKLPFPGPLKGVNYLLRAGHPNNSRTINVDGFGTQPFYKRRFGQDKYALKDTGNITSPLKTNQNDHSEHRTDYNRPVPVQVFGDETKIVGGQQSRGSAIRG